MSSIVVTPAMPDHTQLPDHDGSFMMNFQSAQTRLLIDALEPQLARLHPQGDYCIGRYCGIYYRLTDPPLGGCRSPDWFYVPGVPATLDGQLRRSYVLWQEMVAPIIVIEYVSGTGAEEHEQTPGTGKFWVYEQAVRVPYYAIFDFQSDRLEMYRLVDGRYQLLSPNEHGNYPVAPMGVELGTWRGVFENADANWARWFDLHGNVLPTAAERAEEEREARERAEQSAEQSRHDVIDERQRADEERLAREQAQRRADQAQQRADTLAARLRSLGIDPDKP